MISLIKTLLIIISSNLLVVITSSQQICITETFLNKDNSIFICDFAGINKNFKNVNDESQCVHFLGLPDMKVCGEMGLRYKLHSNNVNSSISLRYFSDSQTENQYEIIKFKGKYGWNHWTKSICANLEKGMNFYVRAATNIQFDRFLVFINSREIKDTVNSKAVTFLYGPCKDDDKKHSNICDPDVQYFGWKVTAIILIIVTVGSLILVISLSVTMPYNVWDKPKIERIPVRLSD